MDDQDRKKKREGHAHSHDRFARGCQTRSAGMNAARNMNSLSFPIPEPVKALGRPEEIFPASMERSSLGTFMGSLLAVAALLLLGIGGMLLYCAVRPFGTNPPPPAVCWAAGAGLLFLAFGSVFGSYYYLSGKGDNQQSYLIFPQCLVEILPTQHRIIPWEAIREKAGTGKAAVAALRSFRFSAGAGKDVAFNASLRRHYEFQGTPWRQRHYVRRLSAKLCFVVTAQCPQTAGAMIFEAADELTNSLAHPRYP